MTPTDAELMPQELLRLCNAVIEGDVRNGASHLAHYATIIARALKARLAQGDDKYGVTDAEADEIITIFEAAPAPPQPGEIADDDDGEMHASVAPGIDVVEAVVEVVHAAWHALDDCEDHTEAPEDDGATIMTMDYKALCAALLKLFPDWGAHPNTTQLAQALRRTSASGDEVEIVARALCVEAGREPNGSTNDGHNHWPTWQDYEGPASAAVAAMRPPETATRNLPEDFAVEMETAIEAAAIKCGYAWPASVIKTFTASVMGSHAVFSLTEPATGQGMVDRERLVTELETSMKEAGYPDTPQMRRLVAWKTIAAVISSGTIHAMPTRLEIAKLLAKLDGWGWRALDDDPREKADSKAWYFKRADALLAFLGEEKAA